MTVASRELLAIVRSIHECLVADVVRACEQTSPERLAAVADEGEEDTIYAIDRIGGAPLVDLFERNVGAQAPIVLVAEGLPGGEVVLPRGAAERNAVWRVIVDPIDGTRALMYQKRSAWVLTGVAPNRGAATTLADIELAVQTEIPLLKQYLGDQLWATRGGGAHAERRNRLTGERTAIVPRPSVARTLAHGFASVARFFPGARDELAAIDEEVIHAALGPSLPGKAQCFEDQYPATGGQLYELMAGHDRFIADLRPLMQPVLARRGRPPALCCHPYDLCTELIARELGVIITDPRGEPLRAPLAIGPDVAWVGYANADIQTRIEPLLQHTLRGRGLM